MNRIAIRAENLGKEFAIGRTPNRHPTLRDFVMQAVKEPFLRLGNVLRGQGAQTYQETFWALQELSFEVEAGTVVGIIGRNGAGKSTLLKILSRITDPNDGLCRSPGRVGSLLEVGTGFHPELTGRENIFLNGCILGMRRAEIRRQFDEIVAFCRGREIPRHAGQALFQRHVHAPGVRRGRASGSGNPDRRRGPGGGRCVVSEEMPGQDGGGVEERRTVLFVSHALPVIQTKCQSCLWLDQGRLRQAGKTADVLANFVKTLNVLQNMSLEERNDRVGTGAVRFIRVGLQDSQGNDIPSLVTGENAAIVLHLVNTTGRRLHNVDICFYLEDSGNNRLTSLMNHVLDQAADVVEPGKQTVTFKIPRLPLLEGRYHYSLACAVNGTLADSVQNAGTFHVEGGDFYGSGKPLSAEHGAFLLDYTFDVEGKLTAAA